jgi:AGCS family alanine or glycine:cation symporter
MSITIILKELSGIIWGTPLLVFLLIANIILLYHSKLIPLRGIFHAVRLIKGSDEEKHKKNEEGQITHFQALCNALAATIGLGNISGVAVAIYQGGAGAIFWMWVAAFLGMNTKFFECTLAVMYRGKDYSGQVQGGPMYFILEGMGNKYKILSAAFAIFGLIGTLALFQINQMASFLSTGYGVSNGFTGIFFAIAVAYILMGGLKRISSFTSKVVPLMSGLYLVLCAIIVALNFDKVPNVVLSIFTEALTGKSIMGGTLGYGIMHIIRTGVKRAAFSNEAGIGTAPMAHGNAKTSEPISEGYVAMLGPLVDTIIVCTLTAVVILVSMDKSVGNLNGINLTTYAFVQNLGEIGRHLLGVIIFLFSFSTMIGMANYNKKCWDFLFRGRMGFNDKSFIAFYSITLALAAIVEMGSVVNLIDICYALMAIPNIIGTVYLARKVKSALNTYNKKYHV